MTSASSAAAPTPFITFILQAMGRVSPGMGGRTRIRLNPGRYLGEMYQREAQLLAAGLSVYRAVLRNPQGRRKGWPAFETVSQRFDLHDNPSLQEKGLCDIAQNLNIVRNRAKRPSGPTPSFRSIFAA